MSGTIEKKIIELIKKINIPFCGKFIYGDNKKYYLSPFANITISGIGPIFYINKKDQKIYTILQRRFKDNFQWWFPGGYVELPPAQFETLIPQQKSSPTFAQIKRATIEEYYKNSIDYSSWQEAKQEINDPKKLAKIFKEQKISWPQEYDYNWQSAWQREVLEETGIDLDKFPQKIILDFKFNNTFMIGAERDRLTNIDGKFCAFLGELTKAPKTAPDEETEELKWIALDEIYFDKKRRNFFAKKESAKLAKDKIVNLYTVTLIEEALHEIICHKIKHISKVKNPITGQEISKFNSPQNLQTFIIEKLQKTKITKYPAICEFLSQEFGALEISQDICGKNGDKFYKANVEVCQFTRSNTLNTEKDFANLNLLLENILGYNY